MSPSPLQDAATEAAQSFTVSQRPDGTGTYIHTHHAPEWVVDMVREAHGDMLPDDLRYEMVRDAVDHVADQVTIGDDMDEWADDFCDCVACETTTRTAWLASHLSRIGYVDEYLQETGAAVGEEGISGLLAGGMYLERREVFASVLESLKARAEELAA